MSHDAVVKVDEMEDLGIIEPLLEDLFEAKSWERLLGLPIRTSPERRKGSRAKSTT